MFVPQSLTHPIPLLQIWKKIKKEFPETEITEPQVYQLWLSANEAEWKLDPDQVRSARKVLEKAAGNDVEIVATIEEDGIAAIGFALKEPLEQWGKDTAEIAFDGTCKQPRH